MTIGIKTDLDAGVLNCLDVSGTNEHIPRFILSGRICRAT